MKHAIRHLSLPTRKWLYALLTNHPEIDALNQTLKACCGIHDFFRQADDVSRFVNSLQNGSHDEIPGDRREYGDFQTPTVLTDAICAHLCQQDSSVDIVIEPTFGTGNFVLSALRCFPRLTTMYGVEIHAPYYWITTCRILEWGYTHPRIQKPEIFLKRETIFQHDFSQIPGVLPASHLLVLGNPPWITNAELSTLDSGNVPQKRNARTVRGLEALTGSSNFDISEWIACRMLDNFARHPGRIALLLKHSVITRLVRDLPQSGYPLSQMSAHRIEARAHFKASVEAAFFSAQCAAASPEFTCQITSFGEPGKYLREFGWHNGRFVADVSVYRRIQALDGRSPYLWRQGLKHDCAAVMELTRQPDGTYVNGLHEVVRLEEDLIYGLVKSADTRQPILVTPRKYVIVPQTTLGADTSFIASAYPLLYAYLQRHRSRFEQRKSKIYARNPPFSIFGIGAYAFRPYKIVISGLYRTPNFLLVSPEQGKALMCDDTCYFLGFDDYGEAILIWALLNSAPVQNLLHALTFTAAKRPYTKRLLMRIGLNRLPALLNYQDILQKIEQLDKTLLAYATEEAWERVCRHLKASSC